MIHLFFCLYKKEAKRSVCACCPALGTLEARREDSLSPEARGQPRATRETLSQKTEPGAPLLANGKMVPVTKSQKMVL